MFLCLFCPHFLCKSLESNQVLGLLYECQSCLNVFACLEWHLLLMLVFVSVVSGSALSAETCWTLRWSTTATDRTGPPRRSSLLWKDGYSCLRLWFIQTTNILTKSKNVWSEDCQHFLFVQSIEVWETSATSVLQRPEHRLPAASSSISKTPIILGSTAMKISFFYMFCGIFLLMESKYKEN